MKGLLSAVKAIQKARTIAVVCHINPDGDTIGSMLSLSRGLKKLGKRTVEISYDGIPPQYLILAGAARVKKKLETQVDLAITVDCNSPEMVGPVIENLRENAGSILAVDHHLIREPYEDIAFIDTEAAAVGEMVYLILKSLKVPVDRETARSILTSIIVETNSFRLPSVRAETFKICSELVGTGSRFNKLVEKIFWQKNKEAVILVGLCLSRCKFLARGRLAWTLVTRKDLELTGGKDRDVDVVPDEIRAISGVQITVVFREQDGGKIRVSLRSKKNINVGQFAKGYGGGGHSDVAGCIINNSSEDIKKFLNKAKKLLK